MPFPIVYRLPDCSEERLIDLRREIVKTLNEMGFTKSWCTPIFPTDRLPEPSGEADGGNTIYCRLDTGFFHEGTVNEGRAPHVVSTLCRAIWDFFGGRYAVEVGVGDLDPKFMKLTKARL
jgi:hypothetical protein